MEQGENTTYIRYTYKRGTKPLTLFLKTLVNYRDYHSSTHVTNNYLRKIEKIADRDLQIQAFADAASLYLSGFFQARTNNFTWEINNNWYRNFALAVEKYRGLDDTEDHLLAATGNVTLQPEDSLTIIASTKIITVNFSSRSIYCRSPVTG
jgi:hypothetical protein